MKEQYVGDIGDFGKVLLLKHLAACGFRVGVNWVLTPNDNRTDGKHRDYVKYKGKDCLRCCDRDIYEAILPLANREKEERAITDLEALIRRFAPSAVFFNEVFESGVDRTGPDRKARSRLVPELCDLVFFDPDNGIGGEDGISPKHIYYSELDEYWEGGQSILVYHHLNREKKSEEEKSSHQSQIEQVTENLSNKLKNSKVLSYRMRRGTARAYFLCLQPGHVHKVEVRSDITSIQPLLHTKSDWRKQAKTCTRIH
ncbi:MAG: hypothetical protein ACLQHF_18220 [Terracidiphilus sp.]